MAVDGCTLRLRLQHARRVDAGGAKGESQGRAEQGTMVHDKTYVRLHTPGSLPFKLVLPTADDAVPVARHLG